MKGLQNNSMKSRVYNGRYCNSVTLLLTGVSFKEMVQLEIMNNYLLTLRNQVTGVRGHGRA